MDKLLKKFLEVEVKAAENDERSFWFTASTEDRDRDGDILMAKGWKLQHFKKNPVILWAHSYSRPPIGKATEVEVKDGKLSIKVQFVPGSIDPFAEQVFQLVKNGFLKTVSVGFMPMKVEALTEDDKKQRPEIPYGRRISAELFEVSVVPVPANPNALRERSFEEVMVKGFGAQEQPAQPDIKELDSPLLPYMDSGGEVNPRLVKASLAALLGARGGVKVPDADRAGLYAKLVRLARESALGLPDDFKDMDLKQIFADVWHEELLDVLNAAKAAEEETEAKAQESKEKALEATVLLKGIIDNLAAVKAAIL